MTEEERIEIEAKTKINQDTVTKLKDFRLSLVTNNESVAA